MDLWCTSKQYTIQLLFYTNLILRRFSFIRFDQLEPVLGLPDLFLSITIGQPGFRKSTSNNECESKSWLSFQQLISSFRYQYIKIEQKLYWKHKLCDCYFCTNSCASYTCSSNYQWLPSLHKYITDIMLIVQCLFIPINW